MLQFKTPNIEMKHPQPQIDFKQTNRKIIHKNYFGVVGSVNSDADILHNYDGYETVYKFDAYGRDNFEDFTTGEFTRSEFPNYAEDGKLLRFEFFAKWDKTMTWGFKASEYDNWLIKPDADPTKYQRYVLESDANNSRDEYFRLYYHPDATALAFITNIKLYKVSPPEYVFAT